MKITQSQAFLYTGLIAFLGAGLTVVISKLIGWILILGSILGLLSRAIYDLIRHYKIKISEIVFFDDFSNIEGWKPILNPDCFALSDKQKHSGLYSFRKIARSDPDGGYKLIERVLKPGFCFSGWIYRPKDFEGGVADRLALEDKNGNGYGFSVIHRKEHTIYRIGIRENSFPKGFFLPAYQIKPTIALVDDWYNFEFIIMPKGEIIFRIHFKGNSFPQINVNPWADAKYPQYKVFNRVAIHGGYEYFVDDLKIIRL